MISDHTIFIAAITALCLTIVIGIIQGYGHVKFLKGKKEGLKEANESITKIINKHKEELDARDKTKT